MNRSKYETQLRNSLKPKEEFKRIILDGKLTTYLVSSYGYVLNTNYRMTGKTHVLKDRVDENGYHSVYIYYNGNRTAFKVHRLVAEHFILNPENKPEVNHIDGDKSHNEVWNLEWATRTENMQHAVRTGLHKALTGEDHPESIYSNDEVRNVCELIATGKYSVTEISEMTGMNRSSVSNIAFKKNHTDVSNDYNFDAFVNHENRFKYPERNWKYTPEQFHAVCQEFVNNKLTFKEIAEKTGVSYGMIQMIFAGQKKTEISSKYDFSHYDKRRIRKRNT